MNTTDIDQVILDCVTTHGPINMAGIFAAVGAGDQSALARRLHALHKNGAIERDNKKRYRIGAGQADLPTELLDQMSRKSRQHLIETGQLPPDIAPTAAKKPTRLHDLAPTRTPRIEDLETPPPDPVETLLTQAVANAQNNLDAFMHEVGDIAACMGALIDARDRTVEALESYQHSKHRSSAA